MSFLDEFKRLARPYEDEEDEDDYEELEPVPTRSQRAQRQEPVPAVENDRRSNKVVNIHTTTQLQVVLVKPDRFENAAEIADLLRE